tara:strand:+ start:2495 stop:4765 length:2271 start_codon:yes stop_codon:yes gene_type:complete
MKTSEPTDWGSLSAWRCFWAILVALGYQTGSAISEQDSPPSSSGFGHLPKAALLHELDTKRERTLALKAQAIANTDQARERLAKTESLVRRGFASSAELAEVRRQFSNAYEQQLALNAHLEIIRHARLVASTTPEKESAARRDQRTASTMRLPGISQRYGNLELFTLTANLDRPTMGSLADFLEAQSRVASAGGQVQKLDARLATEKLSAIQALRSSRPMELTNARTQHQNASAEQKLALAEVATLQRQIGQLRALANSESDESSETAAIPWLEEPVGMLGSGWRFAAPANPDMIRICLPWSEARQNADGLVRMAEADLVAASYRLSLVRRAQQRDVAGSAEVRIAERDLALAGAKLDVAKAEVRIAQQRHQMLVAVARKLDIRLSDHLRPVRGSIDTNTLVDMMKSELDLGYTDPAFRFGYVRIAERLLNAIAKKNSAKSDRDFRASRLNGLKALRSARSSELRWAEVALQKAEGRLRAATQDHQLKELELIQWASLGELLRENPNPSPTSLDPILQSEAQTLAKLQGQLEQHRLAGAKIRLDYQTDLARRTLRLRSASSYEREKVVQLQKQAHGQWASANHQITLARQTLNFASSLNTVYRPYDVVDLPSSVRQQLHGIAHQSHGSNAGEIASLDAEYRIAKARADRLVVLLHRGVASREEVRQSRAAESRLAAKIEAERAKSSVAQQAGMLMASVDRAVETTTSPTDRRPMSLAELPDQSLLETTDGTALKPIPELPTSATSLATQKKHPIKR